MNEVTKNLQSTLFEDEINMLSNPLKDRRVAFIGRFSNKAELLRRCIACGVTNKSKKEGQQPPSSLIHDTHILFVGTNVSKKDQDKFICYKHDGYHPLVLTENDLRRIFAGETSGYETPKVIKKQISIDLSYYNWIPPMVEDEDDPKNTIRCSSPLAYGEANPIYGKEIFVPAIPGVNMQSFRQIIGNLGGYANTEYYDETNVILLSDDTLRKLEQGIKDDTICYIEDKYNNGSSPMFNVQFTCESDFIKWVEKRVEKFNDESTRKLLEVYFNNKS